MQMISYLVVDTLFLLVDPFESAMDFHYLVWYGQASFGVESLHICHSVVYTEPLEYLDAP